MAYGDLAAKPYTAGGTPTDSLASRDLGRAGSPTPMVQEVTHEITGMADLVRQVATAGTRVRLTAASTKVRKVIVQALATNSGIIVVGGATVVAAAGTQASPTRRGFALGAGDWLEFQFHDLTDVWLDATVNNDGVAAVYWT